MNAISGCDGGVHEPMQAMAPIELLAYTCAPQKCAPPLMLMCSATLCERVSIAVPILQTVLTFSLVPRPSIHLLFFPVPYPSIFMYWTVGSPGNKATLYYSMVF